MQQDVRYRRIGGDHAYRDDPSVRNVVGIPSYIRLAHCNHDTVLYQKATVGNFDDGGILENDYSCFLLSLILIHSYRVIPSD